MKSLKEGILMMRDRASLIFILSIFITFSISGCYLNNHENPQSKVIEEDSTNKKITPFNEQNLTPIDEYFTQLALDLDICLNIEFQDGKEISQPNLYFFFEFIVTKNNLFQRGEIWFDESIKAFRIPVSEIEPLLKKYLDIDKFVPELAFEKNFNFVHEGIQFGYLPEKNQLLTRSFGEFGGAANASFLERKEIEKNKYKITVGYFVEGYEEEFVYKKTLIIETDPTNYENYKIISIVKHD